jgi:DNA-binding PadR family transcriptional regulator
MAKQRKTVGGLGRFGDPGVLVLLSLSAGARHGHAMIADIDEQFGMKLGPGTLYGAIAKLVEKELIVALPGQDRRRPYEITPAGRDALTEYLATWAKVVSVGAVRLGQA